MVCLMVLIVIVIEDNETQKGYFNLHFFKDMFGFAEHQGKATYSFGYKSTITRNTDNAVLNKDNKKSTMLKL